MLKYDGKEFRNLQEQVGKNKSDIEFLFEHQGVLNEFGIKVVGVVSVADLLPESAEDYGDAYAVGTEPPYDLWIWTRANNVHPNDYWFNIGEFPLAGPQGPVGPTGPQGIQGERGIQGPQGVQGIQGIAGATGPQGPTGAQGVQGQQGPKGDPGEGFRVVGTLSNVSQLPDPSITPQSDAYLVTIDGAYHLYLLVGDTTLLWTDCGRIEGVQGPQGPQGIQGPQGPKGDTGDTGAKGDQGIQGIQGPQGNTGPTGVGIQSITLDGGTTVASGTQYVMTITYTDSSTATQTFIAPIGPTPTLDGFVEKTTTASQIYGTDSDGNQTTFPQSSDVVNNAFVKRKSDGQIRVPTTPSNNADAASKGYVDSHSNVDVIYNNSTGLSNNATLSYDFTPYKYLILFSADGSMFLPLTSLLSSKNVIDTWKENGLAVRTLSASVNSAKTQLTVNFLTIWDNSTYTNTAGAVTLILGVK